jgi:2-polyprenyl-3-methyl-5-hydroxy-6-metoxy-1,4-benzoquinol methylase
VKAHTIPNRTGPAAACVLCGGRLGPVVYPYGVRWSGQIFRYRRCSTCGSSSIDPVPTEAQIESMYRQDSYHGDFYSDVEKEPTESFLPALRGDLPETGKVLDFGCGNGAFLRQAAAAGFAPEGVELDPEARRVASENSGCRVMSWEELIAAGHKYHIIHLGDVLEHLPRPAETLVKLECLLEPDGCFFLEGPIEDNPSLVYAAAKLFGGLKRLAGRPVLAAFPPYHLYRTSSRLQRWFIEERMGYRVERHVVIETGWPYLQPDDRLTSPRGLGHAVRMLIGYSARPVATIVRPLGFGLGNRFATLAVPQQRL